VQAGNAITTEPMAVPLFVLWFLLIGLGPAIIALHVRKSRVYGFGLPIVLALVLLVIERIWIGLGWPLAQGDLALPYLIGLGMLAPAVGEGIKQRWTATRVMLTALGLNVALRFLFACASANVAAAFGLHPVDNALLSVEGTDPFLGILVGLNGMLMSMQGGLEPEMDAQLLRMAPAMLFYNLVFAAFITFFISRRLLEREGWHLSLERLDRWRAPESMIFAVIASGAIALVQTEGPWADIGLNLFLVTMVPFLFQGLAILTYWFGRFKLAGWLRALLFALIIIQPITIAALAAAGVGDIWFDLRRLSAKPDEDEEDEDEDDEDEE